MASRAAALVLVLLATAIPVASAHAQTPITGPDVLEHLRFLQEVGEANGNRGEGFGGDVVTEDYIAQRLEAAGWTVTRTRVDFPLPQLHAPPVVGRLPERTFMPLAYSGDGDVVARVKVLRGRGGCRRGDYRGARGRIALSLFGGCSFRRLALNAQQRGAKAILVASGDSGIPAYGTLLGPGVTIPALLVNNGAARTLARRRPRIRVAVDTTIEFPMAGENVVAELPGTEPTSVVMAGGHLDSVPLGPGMNDNGSGIAGLLEIAERLAQAPRPRQTLRLSFWPAEELNLYGSRAYVNGLPPDERRRIAAYVNLDMIGSPNGVPELYANSRRIEQALRRQLPKAGRTPVDAGSDHLSFMGAGIPVGGIYTGGPEIKTRRQARRWGGRAGRPRDPCYHRFCDDLDNVDAELTARMATVALQALQDLAR